MHVVHIISQWQVLFYVVFVYFLILLFSPVDSCVAVVQVILSVWYMVIRFVSKIHVLIFCIGLLLARLGVCRVAGTSSRGSVMYVTYLDIVISDRI